MIEASLKPVNMLIPSQEIIINVAQDTIGMIGSKSNKN